MIWACKLLLLGDSLMVALGNHYVDDVNMGKVGDSISGTIQRVEQQGAPECKITVIGLGSNVLYNNLNSEIKKYDVLIQKLGNRSILVMPVPAKGKHLKKSNAFNAELKALADKHNHVAYVPLLPSIRKNLVWDNIHLKYKANEIWKNQITGILSHKVYIQGVK